MSKECVFYEWKGGSFYCNVAQRDINDEIVHRYCWTYDSEECPLRKKKDERKKEEKTMANDGWFKCEDCGYAVKAKVPDYVQQLSSPCPHCGGKMKKV